LETSELSCEDVQAVLLANIIDFFSFLFQSEDWNKRRAQEAPLTDPEPHLHDCIEVHLAGPEWKETKKLIFLVKVSSNKTTRRHLLTSA
jgi:hypothetical protein